MLPTPSLRIPIILGGKVCRQKPMAFKGVDSKKMWKEVTRSFDDIEEFSKILNEKLSLHKVGGIGNVNIRLGILHWRALLRHLAIC